MMEDARLSRVFTNTFMIFGKNFGKLFVGGIIAYGVVYAAAIPLFSWIFQALNIYQIGYITRGSLLNLVNGTLPSLIVWGVVILAVSILAGAFSGAYTTCVTREYISGQPLSWKRSFGQVWKPFGKTILTELAMTLITAVLLSIVVGLAAALIGMVLYTKNILIALFGPLSLMLLELAIAYFLLHFYLMYAVTAYEGRSGFGALVRAFELFAKGGYGRNLGHLLIITLIVGAGSCILEIPIMLGIFVGFLSPVSGILITGIFTVALSALVRAVAIPFYTLEYNHSIRRMEQNKVEAKEE